MFRIGWAQANATLVAQSKVRDYWQARDGGPSYKVQVWDYMVELSGDDGPQTLLVIRVKGGADIELPALGSAVPVRVNRRRTKAAFDLDDPTISLPARRKLGEQRRKDKDAEKRAKFEAKRSEHE